MRSLDCLKVTSRNLLLNSKPPCITLLHLRIIIISKSHDFLYSYLMNPPILSRQLLPFIKSRKNYFISRLTNHKSQYFILYMAFLFAQERLQQNVSKKKFYCSNFHKTQFWKITVVIVISFPYGYYNKIFNFIYHEMKIYIYLFLQNALFPFLFHFFIYFFGGWQWCMLCWILCHFDLYLIFYPFCCYFHPLPISELIDINVSTWGIFLDNPTPKHFSLWNVKIKQKNIK